MWNLLCSVEIVHFLLWLWIADQWWVKNSLLGNVLVYAHLLSRAILFGCFCTVAYRVRKGEKRHLCKLQSNNSNFVKGPSFLFGIYWLHQVNWFLHKPVETVDLSWHNYFHWLALTLGMSSGVNNAVLLWMKTSTSVILLYNIIHKQIITCKKLLLLLQSAMTCGDLHDWFGIIF